MKNLLIHGYADNECGLADKPAPLVHMLVRRHGNVQSISFDPKFAKLIAAQIVAVAETALAGLYCHVELPVCEDD